MCLLIFLIGSAFLLYGYAAGVYSAVETAGAFAMLAAFAAGLWLFLRKNST